MGESRGLICGQNGGWWWRFGSRNSGGQQLQRRASKARGERWLWAADGRLFGATWGLNRGRNGSWWWWFRVLDSGGGGRQLNRRATKLETRLENSQQRELRGSWGRCSWARAEPGWRWCSGGVERCTTWAGSARNGLVSGSKNGEAEGSIIKKKKQRRRRKKNGRRGSNDGILWSRWRVGGVSRRRGKGEERRERESQSLTSQKYVP